MDMNDNMNMRMSMNTSKKNRKLWRKANYDLLDDDGTILVTCEFCKTERRFGTDVLAG